MKSNKISLFIALALGVVVALLVAYAVAPVYIFGMFFLLNISVVLFSIYIIIAPFILFAGAFASFPRGELEKSGIFGKVTMCSALTVWGVLLLIYVIIYYTNMLT